LVPDAKTPLILVTNDDGIRSPGLQAAAETVLTQGELIIAAPRWQQTAAGRSLPASFTGRIYEETIEVDGQLLPAYAVEGSPAQVVQHAILELAPRLPDLVVAGINYGENLGSGITVSGTVGAALEAATFGIIGLAASLGVDKQHHRSHSTEVNFEAAIHFTSYFARQMLNQEVPFDVDLLKIDIPSSATPETPWRLTRVSRQRHFVPIASKDRALTLPGPMDYKQDLQPEQLEPDSDIYAFVIDGIVSASPLSFDLTARVDLAQFEQQLRQS
jgi:5'-nucleotidase